MSETDRERLIRASIALGIDASALPNSDQLKPPPSTPPYHPLSEDEWRAIQVHIASSISMMRPPGAGRAFIENLLVCHHSKLSTRYLPDEQEATRQRALRWSLDGRLEKLAADLRAAGQLDEDRLAAFDALAAKAKHMRERIVGSRAVRLTERTSGQPEGAV